MEEITFLCVGGKGANGSLRQDLRNLNKNVRCMSQKFVGIGKAWKK